MSFIRLCFTVVVLLVGIVVGILILLVGIVTGIPILCLFWLRDNLLRRWKP
jgi:hypothetical protein